LYWVMDGSGLGFSQPQFWHAMPWGRPPQQSQHRAEGDLQGVLAKASTQLPRCLLLDDQSPAQHARHDRRALQRRRQCLPAYPADRLCERVNWLISGLWFRSQAPRAPPVFVVAEALLMSSEEAHKARNSWS